MEIIKQRFAEHITLAQQVAESRILEQVAEVRKLFDVPCKTARRFCFAATAVVLPTVSIWRLNS